MMELIYRQEISATLSKALLLHFAEIKCLSSIVVQSDTTLIFLKLVTGRG
jgi:tmRNA-binding protein